MPRAHYSWRKRLERQLGHPGASIFSWSWRLILLGIFGAMAYTGPDWMSLYLASRGNSFGFVFAVIIIYADLPLIYYYYFSGWSSREVIHKTVNVVVTDQDIALVEKIEVEQGDAPFNGVKRWVIGRIKHFDQQISQDKVGRSIKLGVKAIKSGNVVFIFLLSLVPVAGWKVLASVFFGTTKARNSFVALILGNTVRTIYMIEAWRLLYGIFGEQIRVVLFWVIFLFVFLVITRLLVKGAFHELAGKFLVKKFLFINGCLEAKLAEMNKERSPEKGDLNFLLYFFSGFPEKFI